MKTTSSVICDGLFYFFSFTWGVVMSVIGGMAGIILTITGHKPRVFHRRVYWEVGKNWGGVELGCFFLCSHNSSVSLKQHEAGHGLQNIVFGPLMPFIVCIPSAIRYWVQEIRSYQGKYIFSFIVTLLGIALSVGIKLIAILLLHVIWLDILGSIVALYFIYLGTWLLFFETPKYENNNYVPYDAVWFEASATRLGEKYFKE